MTKINGIAMMLAAAIGLGATGLYAQSTDYAKIPFDFTVKAMKMPAGEYAVTRDLAAPDTIQIRNVQNGRAILVVTYEAALAEPGTDSARMIFNRYGNRYFFSGVWTANGAEHRTVPSKLEQEMKAEAGRSGPSTVAVAVAGTR